MFAQESVMDIKKLKAEFEKLKYIEEKLEYLNFDEHLGCYVEKNNGMPVGLAAWVNGALYGFEQAVKAQAVPEGFGDIQSWIAVNSFSALDASIVDFPVVDANELAEFIDSLNIDVAVPEGFVLVKKELPEQIAEKMAIDRIDKPRHENDPVWREIAEQSYKDQVKSKKWEFWRDYKAMIEAQEQSHD